MGMLLLTAAAQAQDSDVEIASSDPQPLMSRAARLRTSVSVIDPDTVWIGHIADPAWRPRDRNGNVMSSAAYPSIATGGYGPYHVGRGDYRPGIGPGANYNGVWDWDHFQPGETDSLMGWWPLARPYQSGGHLDDKKRPFFGFDYGNVGNYVINQELKRTFGVTGYWHRDVGRNNQPLPDTGTVIPGPNVEWKPISGGASAWCGLRAKGDMTHVDPITGNAYNQTILSYHGNNSSFPAGSYSSLGTDTNYPGYGSQWDQMLYQDIVLTGNGDLQVSFKYATLMSRVRGGAPDGRIGYFYLDPTKTPIINDGNFISATDAEPLHGGPVDSFMVYIGLPVDESACRYANGSIQPVFDPQRRWFSEVLKLDSSGRLGMVQQLLAAAGETGEMASNGTIVPVTAAVVVPSAVLSTKLGVGPGGGTVRLVFRVKTNRGDDDEHYGFFGSFTSMTRGAAIVDDVVLSQGGPNLLDFGDFESAASVDNAVATPATAAWKSTGKPPGIYVHVHTVDPSVPGAAAWNDPCSAPLLSDPNAANRNCNMIGNVLTGGDHDNAEKPGGLFGAPDQDRARWAASPTINMCSNGVGDYNAMGIDRGIAQTTDIVVSCDVHNPGFREGTGNSIAVGLQSFPGRQANGLKVWGEVRHTLFTLSFILNNCPIRMFPLQSNSLLLTSNETGVPDSIRVYLLYQSRCFPGISAANCSPVSPSILTGSHVDNVSVGLVQEAGPPALTGGAKFMDAFPATETAIFTSANFDTCAALVRNGFNLGGGGIIVLGDTASVSCPEPGVRVDLVFRILPGVGNYVQIGNRASGLRKVPTSTTPAIANAASGNFWESYMGHNGEFGTIYPGNSHAMPGGKWDPDGWCSARMDTAQWMLFPCENLEGNASALVPGSWVTSYHEADPKFVTLGIAKNRCFIVDPSMGAPGFCRSKTSALPSECNIVCGTHPVSPQFPPLWTNDFTSGLSPSENGLPRGQTYEFTKIIPDGQLTPGAHVQYFYRREPGRFAAASLEPDTNYVFNVNADAARWYHFSVLPDRWKDEAWAAGGVGMACLLVHDLANANPRPDEPFWVSVADSIGLTFGNKRGSHNGWRARGDQGTALQGDIGGDDTIARRDNGGQPGTQWDLWNGGLLASRLATLPAPGSLMEGKEARIGPRLDMLRWFYRNLLILAGDVGNLGSLDKSLLNDFALIAGGTPKPRSVYVIGSAFFEASTDTGFFATFFGATLKHRSFGAVSGNRNRVVRYIPGPGTAVDVAGAAIGLQGVSFGLADGCGLENDILQVNTALPTAMAQLYYENVGSFGPYVGAVYAPNGGSREHITYLDGTRISRIGNIINFNPSGEPILPMGPVGPRVYLFKSLSIAMPGCGPHGNPVGVGDGPGTRAGSAFLDYMKLHSSNPLRSGEARLAFGLATRQKVEVVVYDVTGRKVRTVAWRTFAAGQEHVVIWDGTTDSGERVRSGVYFFRLRTPTWTSQKKLTVLAH